MTDESTSRNFPASSSSDSALDAIEIVLRRIEHLADELRADPDGHVRRSASELRGAFVDRAPVEPAVTRMRDGIRMLRRMNHDGARREFQRRARGLDQLDEMIVGELLPLLRRMSFDV
jgi:hypothetical protein